MIRLIVTDIDGCLTGGGTERFPLEFFRFIQEWNQKAEREPSFPPITVCSGRPQPYVEAILQAIGGFKPAICESGGVFYELPTRTMLINPAFTKGWERKYLNLLENVKKQFINSRRPIVIEPGKYTEVTIIPYTPLNVDSIWDEAKEFIKPFTPDFRPTRTRSVINFSTRIIDKGIGVKWLAQKLGIDCAEIAGFGDAPGDVPFLKEVGFSGCPANAMPEVKPVCNFVSNAEYYNGFLEFLKKIQEML